MRSIVVVLGLLAVGVAALTAMLINRYVAGHTAQPPVVAAAPLPAYQGEEVLVAATEIKPGTVLKSGDLRYRVWPAEGIDGRLVKKSDGADATFIGAIARRAFLIGEPLSADAVFRPENAGVMAGMLSSGMRAVSIPVTAVNGVSGFIMPGDRIDILLNADVRAVAKTDDDPVMNGEMARFASEVVLADVRVIAIDDKLAKPDGSANLSARTITVEVSPKDAEMLLTTAKLGDFSFALRSMVRDEGPVSPPKGFTPDIEASRSLQAALGLADKARKPSAFVSRLDVRINRAGATSMQSFSN